MSRFTPARAALLLTLTTASLASAQAAPSKVNQQGGAMTARDVEGKSPQDVVR